MTNRIRHIAGSIRFLRPGALLVIAFWSGVFLLRQLHMQRPDGIERLSEMYYGIRPFSGLPLGTLGLFVFVLVLLLTELLQIAGPRRSYWTTGGLVCGTGTAAFFASWWLWEYLGKHYSRILICDQARWWKDDAYVFVLSLVAGAILFQAWPRRQVPEKVVNAGVLITALAGLGALVLVPPRDSDPITIAAFPAVLMVLVVMAATALEALLPEKGDKSSHVLSLAPPLLAGAVLPTIAVAVGAGIWLVASTAGSLFIKDLNARLVPNWNHPELLQQMTGRIYRVKRLTPKGAELQFFNVQAGQWQSVPNAPAPTGILGTPGKWDVAGNLFAYVPLQEKQLSDASGLSKSGPGPGELLSGNCRKVQVVSLEDGHRVASIDISTLPDQHISYIHRLRIAPDRRRIAILFKRSFHTRSGRRPSNTPSRSFHAIAIYELPSGRFVRVLKDMEVFPVTLDWLPDSRHIVVTLLDRSPPSAPKPGGNGPMRRQRARFLAAAVDIENSQCTILAPNSYFDATVSAVTGNVFVHRNESELNIIAPAAPRGQARKLKIIPYPWFRLLGVSPKERLLLGSAVIPFLGSSNLVQSTGLFLLIVDTKSPETVHILDRSSGDYLGRGGDLLWRPVKQ